MVNNAYPHDPAVHVLIPNSHQIVQSLRRETGQDCLVVYHHQVYKNMVVALFDGHQLLDVGTLGDGECDGVKQKPIRGIHEKDEAPWITKRNFQAIVNRLKCLIDKTEMRRRLKKQVQDEFDTDVEQQEAYHEGIRAAHHHYHRKFGEISSERWAQRAGVKICSGEW